MPPTPPTSGLLGPLARRPVVSVAVLLVVGILLHDHLPPSLEILLAAATGLAALAWFLVDRRFPGSALVALTVVLGGIGLAQRAHLAFATTDIGLFATDEARLATVEAEVATEPQVIATPVDHGPPMPPRQTFLADVHRVLTVHGWVRATGQLPVRVNQPNPALTAGQTVQMLGMIERPRPAANPGEFDWAVYYRRQRITATLTVNRPANARVLAGPGFSPLLWVRTKARHLLAAGFSAAHAADLAVLQAVLLGDHSPDFRDAAEDFRDAGVAYHLNVSGLHVALLTGGLMWLCRRLRLRPRHTLLAGTAFVLAYAAVATPSYAGWRATVVAVVVGAGFWIRRTSDRLTLIATAFIGMLAINPLDLYTEGFQLSAATVVAMLFLLPAVQRGAVDPDRPPRRRLTAVAEAVRQTAIFSTLAWFATVPLIAAFFGQLTPWALVGAIAMFPLAAVALYAGAAKIGLTLLWPSTAGPMAMATGGPVVAMRALANGLVRLPGSHLQLGAPPTWAIVAYYAVLLCQLIPAPRGWRYRTLRLSAVAGVVGLAIVSAGPTSSSANVGLRVTLLSLGAGQCAVVQLPDGHAELIDAGSSTVPELDRRIVGPFLQSHGHHRIDDVFLSHGDYDHISAAGDLADTFAAGAVFTSRHFRHLAVGNEPDEALLAKLDQLHLPPRELASGDHVDLGGGAAIDVLWPPPDGTWKSNDAGLVLRLTYAGRRILFPADIQDPAFAGLLQHPERLPADVLVAPHHGSSGSLTPAFLAAVHPSMILSSNAARLTAKQRRFNGMVGGATPLLRTPQCGAITVTVSPDGRVSVETYLHKAADVIRGLHSRPSHE